MKNATTWLRFARPTRARPGKGRRSPSTSNTISMASSLLSPRARSASTPSAPSRSGASMSPSTAGPVRNLGLALDRQCPHLERATLRLRQRRRAESGEWLAQLPVFLHGHVCGQWRRQPVPAAPLAALPAPATAGKRTAQASDGKGSEMKPDPNNANILTIPETGFAFKRQR